MALRKVYYIIVCVAVENYNLSLKAIVLYVLILNYPFIQFLVRVLTQSLTFIYGSDYTFRRIIIFNTICYSLLTSFQIDFDTTESVVNVDWENGFVEASAKNNENVTKV